MVRLTYLLDQITAFFSFRVLPFCSFRTISDHYQCSTLHKKAASSVMLDIPISFVSYLFSQIKNRTLHAMEFDHITLPTVQWTTFSVQDFVYFTSGRCVITLSEIHHILTTLVYFKLKFYSGFLWRLDTVESTRSAHPLQTRR